MSEGRSAESLGKNRRERREVAFRRRTGTGVYVEIHEDSEHRRNARSRAQQIFSQALNPPRIPPDTSRTGSPFSATSLALLPGSREVGCG
jgi:hypothetical protein